MGEIPVRWFPPPLHTTARAGPGQSWKAGRVAETQYWGRHHLLPPRTLVSRKRVRRGSGSQPRPLLWVLGSPRGLSESSRPQEDASCPGVTRGAPAAWGEPAHWRLCCSPAFPLLEHSRLTGFSPLTGLFLVGSLAPLRCSLHFRSLHPV